MAKLKRRAALSAAALCLLLAVTAMSVFVRDSRVRALPAQSEQFMAEAADPLTAFRTERAQLRERQRAELNDIIHDTSTDPDTLSSAKRRLMELMDSERTETDIEGVLSARGFEETLVTVSATAVNVLVRGQTLDRRKTAVILDLVLRQTGVTSQNVKIIPINP